MAEHVTEQGSRSSRPDISWVDQELDNIAHKEAGFERPELYLGLGLLSLTVVARQLPNHLDKDHPSVAGLRTVLEEAVGRIPIQIAREALKVLLHLDDAVQGMRIEPRRDEIVQRGLYPKDQWRRKEEHKWRAVVAGEIVLCELDARAATRQEGRGELVEIRLVRTWEELHLEMVSITEGAQEFLGCVGSRSRDAVYLQMIETLLEGNPDLEHCRVLHGPPHVEAFLHHVQQLVRLREMRARKRDVSAGIRVGLFANSFLEPERFIVMNEQRGLVVMPPRFVGHFESGVVFTDKVSIDALRQYIESLYNGSDMIDEQLAASLPVLAREHSDAN